MDASNTFNYFVGVVALTSTLFSALFFFNFYFPGVQMKVLDDLLVETKTLYLTAEAEGLLKTEVSVFIQGRLAQYERMSDSLREVTYRTLSLVDKFLALFRGQTQKIMRLAHEVAQLRAIVMTASQRERARRAQEIEIPQTSEPNPASSEGTRPTSHNSLEASASYLQSSPSSTAPSTIGNPSSHGVPLSSLLPLLDEPPSAPTCWFCSLVSWWKGRPATGVSDLPLFMSPPPNQNRCSTSHDARPMSRSSTLVNEPPPEPSSTNRSWTFFPLRQSRRDGGKINDFDGSSGVRARHWNPFSWWTHVTASSPPDRPIENAPV